MLAWIDLFDAPEYMGMAMKKGTRNYVSLFFNLAYKSVWCISGCGT